MTIAQPHPCTLTPSQIRPHNCRHSEWRSSKISITTAHNFRINTTLHQTQGLTEEVGEPGWLVVMDDGHTGSVKSHQAQDNPVEDLGFHHVTNRNAQ
mgnify:CR=1 FL=1